MPALRVGALAPDFERPDQHGRPFRLSSTRGRPAVVFFFPRAFTPACTAQACAFRDAYEAFTQAGATVVGISTVAVEGLAGQEAFARRFGLPFTLVSDDGSIRAAWGVPRTLGLFPGRVTYVLDAQGRVAHQFASQLRVGAHVRKAIEVVRCLADHSAAPAPAAATP